MKLAPDPENSGRVAHVSRLAIAALALPLARRMRAKHLRRAAAAQGGGRKSAAAPDHPLSGSDRQHRGDQVGRPGGAGAGLPRLDRLQGRHLRQGRHHAVHDRARDLQAEARPGAGRGSRRAGHGQAGRGRLQAADRSRGETGGLAVATLDTSTSTRDNAQAVLQQAQANTRIAEVNYGYTKVARPSTASPPRIWCRSANSSARPRRRSWRPSSRSIRSM